MGGVCAGKEDESSAVEVVAEKAVPDGPAAVEKEPEKPVESAPEPTPEPPKAEPEAAKEPEPAQPEPAAAPAASKPEMTIEFEAAGESKSVTVTEAPLGITFAAGVPLTIKSLDASGSAAKAGAQVGWVFKKVGSEALQGLDY